MFDMVNIFSVFLPQLLRYPNPADPLNGEAAALFMREPSEYERKVRRSNKVKDYVVKYATKEAVDALGQESVVESSLSSFSDDDAASAMDI